MTSSSATSVLSALLAASAISPATHATDATTTLTQASGVHGFDFLPGKWKVHNRRLAQRLKGSHEWIEFEAISETRALLGGLANQDEFRTDYWPNFIGMSFRFFDAQSRRWSIYWMDTRNAHMDPPVIGSFDGATGTFLGNDVFDGIPIVVRFVWSNTDTSTPRWEQAFSADGGRTWETNWIMEFTRA